MQFFTKTALTAAVMTALVQLSPAPIVIAIEVALDVGLGTAAAVVGAAGTVAGTVVTATKDKREVGHPHQIRTIEARQEMNQAAWQSCKDQLATANLNFSGPSPGNVLVQGIPSSCMTLLTVLTGDYNVGNPLPQGSDSALFRDLTNDDISNLENALKANA